jgi:putative FmdB family regulatory protein
MPTYEYSCVPCEHDVALSRDIDNRDDFVICEHCGARMIRVWTPPGITFNGPGFYKTGG